MSAQQLPRRSLAWLLCALVAAILPHAARLPAWVLVVVAVALGWRYRVHQGRWSFPGAPVKALLVCMAFAAVGLHWRTLAGMEPATALLVIAAALKAMELKATRDYLAICYVAYFLVACELLFEQEIGYAMYGTFAVCVVTAALIARHEVDASGALLAPLRRAARMLAQAIPLMLILFVVFPRLAPLWSMPQKPHAAKTGPSDRMSPGDIARLSSSSALAFRASFSGALPPQRELYWRGLVFSEFDGREWRQGSWARYEGEMASYGVRHPATQQPVHQASGHSVDYEVILEASNRPWAYVLGYPLSFDDNLRLGSDVRLMTRLPVSQRIHYRVRSDLGGVTDAQLSLLRRRMETQLPEGFNPRATAMARQWRAEVASDAAYAERVLRWFNREAFAYTLSPPLLGRDSVDDFLFGTRAGFCEHYASAFVFLLRAAGVPARVVVGYQGGERNPFQDYLLVHEFDAHAWAEAWLEGRGWVRFDPTAAVSPERIESGIGDALGGEFLAGSPLAMERYRGIPFVVWVRMRMDLVTYQWAKLVLNYDSERQFALMQGLLGQVSAARLVTALLVCGGAVLLLVAGSLFGFRPARRRDPAVAAYLRVCERLAAAGIERETGEGPLAFARRAGEARPDLREELEELTRGFVAYCYAPLSQRGAWPPLHERLRAFRVRRRPR